MSVSIAFTGMTAAAFAFETAETRSLSGDKDSGGSAAPTNVSGTAPMIVKGNIRYQASADDPGNLDGYDNSTNQRLWTVKIYNASTNSPVHIRSISERADGFFLIENEKGNRFIFDPATKYVSAE